MINRADLLVKKCVHREMALTDGEVADYLSATDGWDAQQNRIVKTFEFRNFYETLAFVNAIAYVIHTENHHPELAITYNRCIVQFNTHSVNGGRGGLSENDFICAAKVDAVFRLTFS
jgi:4a-hydroxytetrahydrobiopterin dehydratase